MKSPLFAFAAGALFGLGLVMAGMGQPAVILRAFDFSSAWDPRLFLLFAGANLVNTPVSAWLRRRGSTLKGAPLRVVARRVDGTLLAGSVLFGVGWGLGGVCPGPGVTALFTGAPHALAFLAAFALGIALHARLHSTTPSAPAALPLNARKEA